MISKYGEEFLPRRATKGSCGYDFKIPYDVTIQPGQTVIVDSGIQLEDGDLGEDYYLELVVRSSLGIKRALTLANTVGIIDSDYRDTIKIALTTTRDTPIIINCGERVMQGIIHKYYLFPNEIKPEAERTGGVGSTGRM